MQDSYPTPSGENSALSNHPSLAEIAAALKNHRKRLGLTQIQVAEKLAISQSFLSKLENGKAEPSALQWLLFCELTQIDPRCVMRSRGSVEQMRSAEPQRPALVPVAAKPLTA